ncbi:hypothetical protein LAWI1_G004647 [Lachnellula willkommii]|uniref:RNase H type-1 domain-containing protein n=1 Tax=Lachnellula willkommii TaxID=215461 RepID=A0A559M810_9HELO|nr:hypothetical protein LAWI1_G004647 [Lachnellula willkommii]
MLNIAPLFKLGEPVRRFGYADDIALLAVSTSLQTNCTLLQKDLQEALDWGIAEGVTFDPKKSELIHFTRSPQDPPPATSPQVSAGTHTIQESTDPLRWLGVYFDRKLSFKHHVRILSAKALGVGKPLRSLGKTTRGVPPIFLQRAVTACVLKKCYFAAETWWPGRARAIHKAGSTKQVSNGVYPHIRLLEKVVHICARAILPVYRTTQVPALYRESRLRPPEIELDLLSQSFAARTARLDWLHPLRARVAEILRKQRPNTRLARLVLALPKTETVNPIQYAPWTVRESRDKTSIRICGPQGRTKEKAAEGFTNFLPTIPTRDIQVFSDGSKNEATDGMAGGGAVLHQHGEKFARKAFSLGPHAEVFDAEAAAALCGAKMGLNSPQSECATDMWVFLDNLEVAMRLLAPSEGSSQSIFTEFCEIARKWPLRPRKEHLLPGAVRVRWVPGHLSIDGNEEADLAAKEGATLPSPPNAICTLASLKRIPQTSAKQALIQYWAAKAPVNYTELMIGYSVSTDELLASRAALGHILAARLQHGDFAAYHNRFNHDGATIYCSCGRPKSPLHFYFCRKSTVRKLTPRMATSDAIPWLLGSPKGTAALLKWITNSRYFLDTCRLHDRECYGPQYRKYGSQKCHTNP